MYEIFYFTFVNTKHSKEKKKTSINIYINAKFYTDSWLIKLHQQSARPSEQT